jgi:hypothetical protein
VANKTGLEFDDRIYWAFVQLCTTVHRSLSDSVIFFRPDTPRELFSFPTELSISVLLASRYIASGRNTAQKTRPLPNNGYKRTTKETPLATPVLLLRECIAGFA